MDVFFQIAHETILLLPIQIAIQCQMQDANHILTKYKYIYNKVPKYFQKFQCTVQYPQTQEI